MAKVTGPLYSETAHGTVGKTIEYSRQRGQNIVNPYRRRVRPATRNQQFYRQSYRIANAITQRVRTHNWTYAGQAQSWIEYWTGQATRTQNWNNPFTRDLVNPLGSFGVTVTQIWFFLSPELREQWQEAATTPITNLPPSLFEGTEYPEGFTLVWAEHTASQHGYGPLLGLFDPPIPVLSAPR